MLLSTVDSKLHKNIKQCLNCIKVVESTEGSKLYFEKEIEIDSILLSTEDILPPKKMCKF